MKVVLISDIHSNAYALENVLKEAQSIGFDELWLLGDIFGYYPWAARTFELILPFLSRTKAILGNHDVLLFVSEPPRPVPSYWYAATQNRSDLNREFPEALRWLESLEFERVVRDREYDFHLCHGTPISPCNGRLYPDNNNVYEWFPKKNTYLLCGHTHYPLFRIVPSGGVIINPGSVGQPRDGVPASSWGVLDTSSGKYLAQRTAYDHQYCMSLLRKINWEPHAIAALNKRRPGKMNN